MTFEYFSQAATEITLLILLAKAYSILSAKAYSILWSCLQVHKQHLRSFRSRTASSCPQASGCSAIPATRLHHAKQGSASVLLRQTALLGSTATCPRCF